METPLISVIVIVYNVEKYLSQCLESIINQTYSNIEIICIDDASTDGSLNILKDYAQKDFRIKVVENEKNIGVGLTRNKGIDLAQGEYIHFIDSDDWIKPNLYEDMQKIIEKNSPEIIRFDLDLFDEKCKKFKENNLVSFNIDKLNCIFRPMEYLEMFDTIEIIPILLLKIDFLRKNNIKFKSIHLHEDTPFYIELLIKATACFVINDVYYHYRINRPKSLINTKYKHFNYYFEWAEVLVNLFSIFDNEEYFSMYKKKMHYVYVSIINIYKYLIIHRPIDAVKYWPAIKQFSFNYNWKCIFDNENKFLLTSLQKDSVLIYFFKCILNYYFPGLLNKIIKLKKGV